MAGGEGGIEREWRPDWPCPAGGVLRQQRHGGADPTYRMDGDVHWRGLRTPQGPATLAVRQRGDGTVVASAWGEGATWALDSVPGLLGAEDDVSGFAPRHPVVAEAWRHHPHLRFSRSGLVFETLLPAIVEQKVTGQEAFAGFRDLVHRFGERAPGPGVERKVWLQPTPERIRRIASWEWLRLHIDPARSRTIVTAARVASSLERLAGGSGEAADQRLRSLPGIGVWTAAEVRQRAFGDADAVSFGDYHVAKDVGWALTGAPYSDEEMAQALEPWRPHRGRVVQLLAASGLHRPRRGPRMAPRTHLPAD